MRNIRYEAEDLELTPKKSNKILQVDYIRNFHPEVKFDVGTRPQIQTSKCWLGRSKSRQITLRLSSSAGFQRCIGFIRGTSCDLHKNFMCLG